MPEIKRSGSLKPPAYRRDGAITACHGPVA